MICSLALPFHLHLGPNELSCILRFGVQQITKIDYFSQNDDDDDDLGCLDGLLDVVDSRYQVEA